MRLKPWVWGLLVLATAGGTACTLLVEFVDQPVAACADGGCDASVSVDAAVPDAGVGDAREAAVDADVCSALPDGAPCGAADPCNDRPTCVGGRCTRHPNDGGAFCGYAGGCNCNYCNAGSCSVAKKCPEGFNWEAGNDLARCCGGLPVLTNTNANCGVCGVVCKTAGVATPQDCRLLGGHYLCVGCTGNTECWSQCCSVTPSPGHCAASDCNTGACPNGICPAPSRCVVGAGASPNYCAY